jgi:hypothetical protein
LQWQRLSRWTWEQTHGPVPKGFVVAHLDGNTMHDDPANYGLRTPGQIAQIAHAIDPEMSRRNRQKISAVTSLRNKLAAQIARRTHNFPCGDGSWYLVDLHRQQILDRRFRSRRQAFAAQGIAISRNGRTPVAGDVVAIRGRDLRDPRFRHFRVVGRFTNSPAAASA